MKSFDEYMREVLANATPDELEQLDAFRAYYQGKRNYTPDPKPVPAKKPKKKGK